MNPPTSNNVTSWQLTNERGMMKNQVLTISKIVHPLNSMHSCYTITCTGNQCPSVWKCYPLVCMYAFLCVCILSTYVVVTVCMYVCKFLYKLTYVLAYFFTHTYSTNILACILKYIHTYYIFRSNHCNANVCRINPAEAGRGSAVWAPHRSSMYATLAS
jgi:hypothetical protein